MQWVLFAGVITWMILMAMWANLGDYKGLFWGTIVGWGVYKIATRNNPPPKDFRDNVM